MGSNSELAGYCRRGYMNADKIKGKIVYCDSTSDGSDIRKAGGVGTIMVYFDTDYAYTFTLPLTQLTLEDGQKVLDYIRSTKNPVATILVSEPETDKDVFAPKVVSFSSRGPNPVSQEILKPDLTAPGANVLAAWFPVAPPSVDVLDTRSVKYNIISGTSMSCSHVSGAAAYLKAAHPNWSAAAIKSALMTTAHVLDPKMHKDLEFAYGSGEIDPLKALNPGLIFNASEVDYIYFLCKQGYTSTKLKIITGDNSSNCGSTKPGKAWDLNYPSFSLQLQDGEEVNAEFTRTVTNVGSPNSTYTISFSSPHHTIAISVSPFSLSFSSAGEKKSFTVKVTGPRISQQPILSGAIVLSDGVHEVRAPLVVYTFFPGVVYIPSSGSFEPHQKQKFRDASLYKRNVRV